MSSKEQYQQVQRDITRLREEAAQLAKKVFSEAATELFTTHPTLQSFTWRQYTPYFNDGEECVFSACTDSIDVVMTDSEEEEFFERSSGRYDYETKKFVANPSPTPLQAAGGDALEFLQTFDDDTFKEMFGDHVSVTVTRARATDTNQSPSVTVDEYNHE